MTDDLRMRLKRIDPMPSDVPTEPATSPSSRTRLEIIMSTPTIQRPESKPRRSAPWFMAAAAVAVVVVGLGAFVMTRDSGAPPEASALQLTAGPSDALASCIVPSAEIIAQTEVAFEGTVTAIDGDVVTLSVDDWFTGGDAEVVTILAPSGFEALIGSVPFAEGEVFLVTATNGIVNYCGLSGPATPELRALFQDAFPG